MDPIKLKARMDAATALDASRAEWTDAEWEAWYAQGVVVIRETWVNERTLYANLGPAEAEEILQRLDLAAASNPVIARIRGWLKPEAGGIDVGNAETRLALDQFSGTVLLANHVVDIKGMAEATVRRDEADGLGAIYAGHIAKARAAQ